MDREQNAPQGHPPGSHKSSDEMIGSLGEALAGVNLGSNSAHSGGFSFPGQHESGDPFRNNNNWGTYNANRGREEMNPSSQRDSSIPQGQESIDAFLSQSPSQLLGNDVYKLSAGNLLSLIHI